MTTGPQTQRPLSPEEQDEKEWLNAENWKLGMFYYSHQDRRIWVPKRTLFGRRRRLGGTPNFAKPAARAYVYTITGLLVSLLLALMLLRKLGVLH
jgi:uncharacterized membrane protein